MYPKKKKMKRNSIIQSLQKNIQLMYANCKCCLNIRGDAEKPTSFLFYIITIRSCPSHIVPLVSRVYFHIQVFPAAFPVGSSGSMS